MKLKLRIWLKKKKKEMPVELISLGTIHIKINEWNLVSVCRQQVADLEFLKFHLHALKMSFRNSETIVCCLYLKLICTFYQYKYCLFEF